jgi:hypothetical protein
VKSKYFFLFFFLIFFSSSCESDKKDEVVCNYTLNDFLKKYDTSRVMINKGDGFTEIFDTIKSGGGDFKFDKNNILRFYGFLLDEKKNSFRFGVNYDSLGNQINTPKFTVVRWIGTKKGNDSLVLNFYLYSINYSYEDVKLFNSNFSRDIELFESDFYSSLICGEATIENPYKKKLFYLKGKIRNNCTKISRDFIDSSYVTAD